MSEDRPSFRDLWLPWMNLTDLARKAEVEPSTVLAMLRAHPVSGRQAEQVLRKFSDVAGQQYSLENVCVPLIQEDA